MSSRLRLAMRVLVLLPLLFLPVAGIASEASADKTDNIVSAPGASRVDIEIDLDALGAPDEKMPVSTAVESLTQIPGVEEQSQTTGSAAALDLSLPKELYSEDVLIDDTGKPDLEKPSPLSNLFEPKKKKESNLSITGKPLFKTVDGPITRDNLIEQVDGASLNVEIKN